MERGVVMFRIELREKVGCAVALACESFPQAWVPYSSFLCFFGWDVGEL